jgi:hypothetical protein
LDHVPESFLSLFIVEKTFLVQSDVFIVPLNDELLIHDLLIDELLHESGCKLVQLIFELTNEVQHHTLQEVLLADLTLLLHEFHEDSLIDAPVLHAISSRWEKADEGDEVKEVFGQIVLLLSLFKDGENLGVVLDIFFTQVGDL